MSPFEKKMGPGAVTPKPQCIALVANACPLYIVRTVEGNRLAAVQGKRLAKTPENAL